MMHEVHNVPEYAFRNPFMVVRLYNGELWFWGAFDDAFRAKAAADEINGIMLTNPYYKEE